MKSTRLLTGLLGIVLFLAAAWQIRAAARGLEQWTTHTAGFPVTVMGQPGALDGSRPVVLVAHGFSGSGTIMRGFAMTLAHAGYAVVLWDFDGHAGNANSMREGFQSESLVENVEAALNEATRLGAVGSRGTAILGHSMGSGAALRFGQLYPRTSATVAVSPVGIPVTPTLPRNLLLLAGEFEPRFVRTAEQRLAEAGGAGGSPSEGTARALLVIPNVEHMSILFSPLAHRTAVEWMDTVFGIQPTARSYTDIRILWFGVGTGGVLLAALFLIPAVGSPSPAGLPLAKRALAVTVAAVTASILLWALEKTGMEVAKILGLRVGGHLLVWFAWAGSLALGLMRQVPPSPRVSPVVKGLLIFIILWAGIGWMSHSVWLPWLLIGPRLVLWPLASLLMLPWFMAMALVSQNATPAGKAGWWLFQSLLLLAALFLAQALSPSLGFLLLILPALPFLILLHSIPVILQRHPWTAALSGALFVSWMLLAVFPLA